MFKCFFDILVHIVSGYLSGTEEILEFNVKIQTGLKCNFKSVLRFFYRLYSKSFWLDTGAPTPIQQYKYTSGYNTVVLQLSSVLNKKNPNPTNRTSEQRENLLNDIDHSNYAQNFKQNMQQIYLIKAPQGKSLKDLRII